MTRDEYLKQLSKYLKKLPKADYDDAMEYFTEYFSETDDNEAKKLMDELGTPKEAACDIISNILDKRIDEKKQADEKEYNNGSRSVFSILWVAILAICAIPVATPLLISGLVVMFCIVLCIVLVVLCVFLVGVCSVIAGLVVIARAIVTIRLSISAAVMLSGLGLAVIGVGIIVTAVGILFSRLLIDVTIKFAQRASKRGKK